MDLSNYSKLALATGGLFAFGVIRAVQTRRFVRRAVRVRARILETREIRKEHYDPDHRVSPFYQHVVEIPHHRPGRRRRVLVSEIWGGSIPGKLAAGGTLPVLYDPAKPDIVRIDSPWTLYFIPAFFCTPALLLFALTGYAWFMT